MRILFWGTPETAAACLQFLLEQHGHVVGVVTQPDKPVGRAQRLTPPPVKRIALAAGLPVVQPANLRSPEIGALLRSFAPEVNILVAYGKLIPLELLKLGTYFINLHFSLLPRYRGAAPVQRALMDGCTQTGVTVQHLAAALDAGDVILQQPVPIEPGDTTAVLLQRCVTIGAPLVQQTLALLVRGTAPRTPQDHGAATQAPKLTQQDGFINWHAPAHAIVRRVCACNPWPGATTWLHNLPLKIWTAGVHGTQPASGMPGMAMLLDKRLLVASGAGVVELIEVQPAGRTRMRAAAFMAGVRQPTVQFSAPPLNSRGTR
ncbi:MAG: methionyl-tRNA formyltransferase [bacterium]|nr:methionyl-tRNA formyltransferase [bacterium]